MTTAVKREIQKGTEKKEQENGKRSTQTDRLSTSQNPYKKVVRGGQRVG